MPAMLHDPGTLLTLILLVGLELVLGWDNVLVITVLAGGVPQGRRRQVTVLGLALAFVLRVAVLAGVLRLFRAGTPIMASYSPADLALLAGGAFLVYKAVVQIHREVEEPAPQGHLPTAATSIAFATVQIAVMDLLFSVDSIAAAVGLTSHLVVIAAAILISFGIVLAAAEGVGNFLRRNPALRILCLAFLLCIGVSLILDGCHQHFPRGYLYGPMAFALLVEALQNRRRKNLGTKA